MPRTVHISHHPRYPPHTLHVLHTPPAATEWRGSPSLEAPFRLRGKPCWVLCASGNPPGCRIGGYAVLHPSGKGDIPCECVQKRVCQMRAHLHTLAHTNASPSDSCVRVVACYADFCVFLRAGSRQRPRPHGHVATIRGTRQGHGSEDGRWHRGRVCGSHRGRGPVGSGRRRGAV